jgi:CspA family cold shock protein
MQGTVKFFDETRGFGFIKPENGDKDVFVHTSNLTSVGGSLQDGQAVSFDTQQGRKGIEAIGVELVSS